MSENTPFPENGLARTVWSRGEIVFAAATCALAAGVFVPVPELLLDILWVCVLSLTIAVGLIFPAASSTADLKGFSAMLSGPALLRIGLVGAMCVRLTAGRPAGWLIPATGRALTVLWPLGAALACLVAAAVLVIVLFGACQRIAAGAERYRQRIYPLKCVGIETDVKMGVISTQQAHTLAGKVQSESRLFGNLAGTSLLMRAEGAIEIAAMLICLVVPFLGTRSGSGMEQIAGGAAAAVGLVVFSFVPAVVAATAAAYLAGKDSLTLRTAPTGQEPSGRTFTLVDRETGQCEEVELLNPDFVGYKQQDDRDEGDEKFAEFEPQHRTPLIETLRFSAGSQQAYYRQLAGAVADASAASRMIVFAAQDVRQLPVTVFVNTAILLAHEGRKILLADADTRRNALSQVFETDAVNAESAVRTTGLEGLDLYPFGDEPEHTKAILAEAAREYSCVLIYAPDKTAMQIVETLLDDPESSVFFFGVEGVVQTQEAAAALHGCRRFFLTPPLPILTTAD